MDFRAQLIPPKLQRRLVGIDVAAGEQQRGFGLWSVADKPTAELMTDFYQHLLGPNPSPSSAMRAAQNAMISGKKYSAPFYWAPFVLVGEWRYAVARKVS